MSWSTREIAELADTSLRAVRHYHEVGLLAEPQRRPNGYKQYGVTHLVRLLRIKRLSDLGFSLAQIQEMGEADDHPAEALRAMHAELGQRIERLQQARTELGVLLRHAVPTDLPPEFATADTTGMSDADRSFLVVMSRVLGPATLRAYAEMLASMPTGPANADFDRLPADADEATRQDLAVRIAPSFAAQLSAHPELVAPQVDAPRGEHHFRRTVLTALRDLYNPAQLDVLRRATSLLAERSAPE